MPAKVRPLICACCGQDAGQWQQWWNQDQGYGVCSRCALMERGRTDAEGLRDIYGEEGVHFAPLPPVASTE